MFELFPGKRLYIT